MNFYKTSYKPILRYIYTEAIKRQGEISLYRHFKYIWYFVKEKTHDNMASHIRHLASQIQRKETKPMKTTYQARPHLAVT